MYRPLFDFTKRCVCFQPGAFVHCHIHRGVVGYKEITSEEGM